MQEIYRVEPVLPPDVHEVFEVPVNEGSVEIEGLDNAWSTSGFARKLETMRIQVVNDRVSDPLADFALGCPMKSLPVQLAFVYKNGFDDPRGYLEMCGRFPDVIIVRITCLDFLHQSLVWA